MTNDAGAFVIVQSSAAQRLFIDVKTERFDQMQLGPRVGTKTDDIACIGRDFGLVENDGEHLSGYPKKRNFANNHKIQWIKPQI